MPSGTVSRRVSEFVGVALFAIALVWFVALITKDDSDAVWFFKTGGQVPPANFIGQVGAFLAEISFQLFGYASYLIPLLLVVLGWHYFWCRAIDAAYTKLVGLSLLFGCTTSILSLAFDTQTASGRTYQAGGYLGEWLAETLDSYLDRTGSIIILLTLLFLSAILSTQFSFGRLFTSSGIHVRRWGAKTISTARQLWTRQQRKRQRQSVLRKHLERTGSSTARVEVLAKSQSELPRPARATKKRTPIEADNTELKITHKESPQLPLPDLAIRPPIERHSGSFALPPAALLDSPKAEQKCDDRLLMENAKLLEGKCREFAVDGSVVQIHPGPVVTTFEFKPHAGVKYNKVTGLADDLCLAMQAESVLIERIPGKSTVGIQIPNQHRDGISLRQLLESDLYQKSSSKLTLTLGKNIHGEPLISDLAKMPHLLIAGSTGTGKSVAMNAMLTSILYRATPDDVRLILIDPKRLELGMYEDIPHLLTPVVVDMKQAANALRWAVREMEERYKRLAEEGVRNIDQFNRNIAMRLEEQKNQGKSADTGDVADALRPLPYVVLAIDELADLMMVARNEVEQSIARLAQMARAVGIHLILATQRPSVDVITGVIKANLPARIAFRVSSKVDSRTILDANGAEKLLGKGDMLYLPPASSRCIRIHGPYISEQETARLVSFLRKQGKPGYDETITADEKTADAIEFAKDDLYDQAARIVITSGQASISYLQRRLRIGFSRAGRLVDMMEADGLVSSGTAGKPREVLVNPDYFEAVDLQPR
jgi:S-DNA-T family DNA segregation ATPase FtsK/SpoIIIE